jgi:hypothetical protein
MPPDPKLKWDVVAISKGTPLTLHSASGYCAPQAAPASQYSFVCLAGAARDGRLGHGAHQPGGGVLHRRTEWLAGWSPGRTVFPGNRRLRGPGLARWHWAAASEHEGARVPLADAPAQAVPRSCRPAARPLRPAASREAVTGFATAKCSTIKADVSSRWARGPGRARGRALAPLLPKLSHAAAAQT